MRSPLILAFEFPPADSSKKIKESEKFKYIFDNRLKYLQKSYNIYLSLLPEVEIDYGIEINDLCKELSNHITHYYFKLTEFIELVDNWDIFNNPYEKELNSIIFNNNQDDSTSIAFNTTIEKLKTELQNVLKKY